MSARVRRRRTMLVLACAMALSVSRSELVRADPPAAHPPTSPVQAPQSGASNDSAAPSGPSGPNRPAPSRSGDTALPQECAQDPFHVDYGQIREGSLVRLGRHRSVEGSANWDPSMEHFVGRVTPVLAARGLDPQGCAIIEVAVDGGEYVWRVRDLAIVAAAPDASRAHVPELRVAPGFVPDPEVYEARLGELTRRASTMKAGCTGWVTSHPTFTMLLEDDFPTFSVLTRASIDTVLVVRTPAGELVCVDDVDGHDPVLTGRAVAGRYEVYVGAFEPVPGAPRFRLALSERSTLRASALDAVPTADIRALEGGASGAARTHLQAGRPRPAAPESGGSGGSGAPGGGDTPPARPSSNTR